MLAAETEGKKLDKKSARTRMRILDAAAEVLSAKGYAGMRLSDVAQVAELQAPAIYYYFPSRDDLIEEVMWVGLADMRKFLNLSLDQAPEDATPLERILVAVEAHLRHQLEISAYATAAIRNSGGRFPMGRVTVNLAPADLKKAGPTYDLPIALGILIAVPVRP